MSGPMHENGILRLGDLFEVGEPPEELPGTVTVLNVVETYLFADRSPKIERALPAEKTVIVFQDPFFETRERFGSDLKIAAGRIYIVQKKLADRP